MTMLHYVTLDRDKLQYSTLTMSFPSPAHEFHEPQLALLQGERKEVKQLVKGNLASENRNSWLPIHFLTSVT